MLKTLPYNALRTLESVVRLRGFGRAAEELNVTQSAVSQHVKSLEEWLGHKLLNRKHQLTEPTEAGERLAEAVREGFGNVEAICDSLRDVRRARSSGLRVAAPPGFAYLWLLPRLLTFDDLHPDTPVSISTDQYARDHLLGDADVTIAYSAGGFPHLHAERLLHETLAPVCAPDIATTLREPADLAGQVMLEDVPDSPEDPSNWVVWAREAGVKLPQFSRKRRFGQANLVVQAAVNGLGVAMGRSTLVEALVDEGKLVQPFPENVRSQYAYWFVCRHDALARRNVRAFRDWLQSSVSEMD